MLEYRDFDVFWDGHATVRIEDNGFCVTVDPFSQVSASESSDLVLITHGDVGHYDRDKLEEVCNEGTCAVIPESMEESDIPCEDVELIAQGEVIDVFGIEIESVPMYNDTHEKGKGTGYRFVMRDTCFYVAGDTGLLDEAYDLEGRVDVAFLPVDGKFTMDVDEAIKMAVRIKPELTIPYHYGKPFFDNIDPDLRGMKAELKDRNLECRILEPE